ncbi:MAG: cytochrome c maturation protein CcmE [Firmicutes bacterium]|nr:cytochrome c maturation protein CcmE [Bacillota bacterium]
MAISRKGKVILGLGVVLAAILFLLYFGFSNSTAYYKTVAEVLAESEDLTNQFLRVSGYLVDEIHWDAENVVLKFSLATSPDDTSGNYLPVVYHGIKPNNFEPGNEAIIEGVLDDNGVFKADKLMVKCPSKYEENAE